MLTRNDQEHLLQLLTSGEEVNETLAETLLQHHEQYPVLILLLYMMRHVRCYESGLHFSGDYPESFFEAHCPPEEWARLKEAYSLFCLLDQRFVNQGGCDYHTMSDTTVEAAWQRFKPYLADYELVTKHYTNSKLHDWAQVVWVEYGCDWANEVLESVLRCYGRDTPEYAEALFWLAEWYREEEDPTMATGLLLEYLEIPDKQEPDNEFSLLNMNFRYMAYSPSTPLAYQYLGEMAWERGERDLAMDYVRRGIEALPTSQIAPRPLLARMSLTRGDAETAIALLETQIEIRRKVFGIEKLPHSKYREWQVHVDLGKLYLQLAEALEQDKKADKALEMYRLAIYCDPFQYYERAEKILEEAVSLLPAEELRPWAAATLDYTKEGGLRRDLLLFACMRLAQRNEAKGDRAGYSTALHWYKQAISLAPHYLDALLAQMRIVAEQFSDYWQLEGLAKQALKHHPKDEQVLRYAELAKQHK